MALARRFGIPFPRGSLMTLRWREMESNFQFPISSAPVFETAVRSPLTLTTRNRVRIHLPPAKSQERNGRRVTVCRSEEFALLPSDDDFATGNRKFESISLQRTFGSSRNEEHPRSAAIRPIAGIMNVLSPAGFARHCRRSGRDNHTDRERQKTTRSGRSRAPRG